MGINKPFPDITIPPGTEKEPLIDKLQRFFVAAMPFWKHIDPDAVQPILPGDASKYYDGTGNWTKPATSVYAVGDIVLTSDNVNPSARLGGTWVAY